MTIAGVILGEASPGEVRWRGGEERAVCTVCGDGLVRTTTDFVNWTPWGHWQTNYSELCLDWRRYPDEVAEFEERSAVAGVLPGTGATGATGGL